jgi:hypothetical protein
MLVVWAAEETEKTTTHKVQQAALLILAADAEQDLLEVNLVLEVPVLSLFAMQTRLPLPYPQPAHRQ